jgi:hypothetical protein
MPIPLKDVWRQVVIPISAIAPRCVTRARSSRVLNTTVAPVGCRDDWIIEVINGRLRQYLPAKITELIVPSCADKSTGCPRRATPCAKRAEALPRTMSISSAMTRCQDWEV